MKLKCNNPKCIEFNGGKPYEWECHSDMMYATCPSCRLKVLNKQKAIKK